MQAFHHNTIPLPQAHMWQMEQILVQSTVVAELPCKASGFLSQDVVTLNPYTSYL